MRLRYTPEALAELDDILGYIKERSQQGARRIKERIQAITTVLLRHPNAGQLTNKPPARRITTAPYPFVIFYKIDDDELIIVGVRHTAREPHLPSD